MPTRHRAKSSAVSCFLNRITSASVALSFLPLSTTFGSPLVFGAYGVIGVFATIIYAGTLLALVVHVVLFGGVLPNLLATSPNDAAGGASGFERRLAAFEARTVVMSDGKTFVGGVPPRSPYVWVKSGDVKASGGALSPVVPSSFTDETGGGQAVAYIVFDPVTLTARDDAERVGAACVKGCTFDAPTT